MKMYTKTELESMIDANGGKPFFEVNPKVKRDLFLEQRALETYTTKTSPRNLILDGRHITTDKARHRYLYHRSDADNTLYSAFVEYMEMYISALGNENIEAVAVEYWQNNKRLSTMTYHLTEKI
jgi:hypothetical protein